MTTKVETIPAGEDYEMTVRVRTKDAVGQERVYEVSINADGALSMIDGAHVMQGTRVDDDAPDEMAGGGPSQRAYEAAAARFQATGYDVHGHEEAGV